MATKRTVTKGEDGFYRVSGQDPVHVYTDKTVADRVAEKLSAGDELEEKAAAEAAAKAGAET